MEYVGHNDRDAIEPIRGLVGRPVDLWLGDADVALADLVD